jgi:hypothetical protein
MALHLYVILAQAELESIGVESVADEGVQRHDYAGSTETTSTLLASAFCYISAQDALGSMQLAQPFL